MRGGWPVAASVASCASLTVVLGLFWGVVAQPAREAAHAAVAHPEPAKPGVTRVADSTPHRVAAVMEACHRSARAP